MAANAIDLTTRAAVAAHGNIDDSLQATKDELDRLVTAASGIIGSLTSRALYRANWTQTYDGDRAVARKARLDLKEFPIVAVSSVVEDGRPLTTGTGYNLALDALIYAEEGYLLRQSYTAVGPYAGPFWSAGKQNITVAYTAGYDLSRTVAPFMPWDLEQAAIKLALILWNSRERTGEASKNFDSFSITYLDALAPDLAAVIKAYERGFRP